MNGDDTGSDAGGDVSEDNVASPFPPPSLDDVVQPDRSDGDADRDREFAYRDPADPSLVGVSFDRHVRAQEFLLAMGRLKQDGALDLQDAVVVVKSEDGKVKVTETVDPSPGRAAVSGAVWTGLIGLLVGGPVGWLAGIGVGAGAGAVTAKLVDLGIPDDWVDWFKQAVRPGTATVIILAANLDLRALEREAERFTGAELLHSTLPAASIDRLEAAFEGG